MEKEYNRWLILAASVMVNLCNGVGYAWSVFIDPLNKLFGWTPSELAFAFTINMGIIAPLAMISSAKIHEIKGAKFNIVLGSFLTGAGYFLTSFIHTLPMLYLTYGIVTGFGFNIAYSSIMGNIIKFFPDRKGLAIGSVLAGLGAGTTVLAPIAAALIKTPGIGVLNTFRILGIILFLIAFACSFFIRNAPDDISLRNKVLRQMSSGHSNLQRVEIESSNWKGMLSDFSYYLLIIMFITAAYTGITIISSASPIGQSMYGLTPQVAAFFVGIVAMCNGLGRIAGGALNDRIGSIKVLLIIYSVTMVMLLALTAANTTATFAAAMVVIGLCYGACMATFPTIISEKYGPKYFTANYGITFIAYAVAAFFAPKIAASIRIAYNGNYTVAFYVAAAVCALGLGLTFLYLNEFKKVQQGELI